MRLSHLLILLFFCSALNAQTGQKPSANYTQEKTQAKTGIASLSAIKNSNDFNKLARVYNVGTFNEIPHLLFTIDRRKSQDKVYYINTPRYEYHLNFINELLNRNYTPDDIKPNYIDSTRRFIFGTISYQNTIKGYTYEFWEGDKLTSALLTYADSIIRKSFADTILFKTNSTLHEEQAITAQIKHITQDQLVKEFPYIALNQGKAKGRIRIADSIEGIKDIDENDILVLKEVPISIPAVAGIITERASTLLSHVNILARGLKIPSIYIKNASQVMAPYDGLFVDFTATLDNYTIKEIKEPASIKSKRLKYSIKSNLTKTNLVTLDEMRKRDNVYCGVKAANLGEIKAKIKNVIVPDGFSIPFSHYHNFVKANNIHNKLNELQCSKEFNEQPEVRRSELGKLREYIELCNVDGAVSQSWVLQWQSQLNGKGVFVRSSSNAEDLKNFSGAGLFTTVPNVKTANELEKAVKKVWASVYNFEAYEARRHAGIPDSLIMMSVFVQQAADSEISGVMITKDPYNPLRWDIYYIAAKRGIGIKVVEGKRIAEQVMFSEKTKAVQLISRSDETTELRLDADGGVKEVVTNSNDKRVMTDELIDKLATYGRRIKKLFNDDMDIEWAVANGEVIILQARPYN